MKRLFLIATLLAPNFASAEGYVLGAGRWTCADVVAAIDSNDTFKVGQIAGWLMGFWSATTFTRETEFIDIVENAGGRAILDTTLEQCRTAPPETLLFTLTQSMISNTG